MHSLDTEAKDTDTLNPEGNQCLRINSILPLSSVSIKPGIKRVRTSKDIDQARRQGGFHVAWKPPTLPIA